MLFRSDFEAFFELMIEKAELSLKGTPELLPILKQSGVVDAGGQGLLSIFQGFLMGLRGEEIAFEEEEKPVEEKRSGNLLANVDLPIPSGP